MLDELVQEPGGQRRAMVPLVLEDDLREGDRGEILPGRDVHDRDLPPGPDQLLELLQRDVAALLRIVELPIGVALDDVLHDRGQSSTGAYPQQAGPAAPPLPPSPTATRTPRPTR